MHSNAIIKNVSWPHFSWPTLMGPAALPRKKGHSSPPFRPMSIVATVAHLSYCWALVSLHLKIVHRTAPPVHETYICSLYMYFLNNTHVIRDIAWFTNSSQSLTHLNLCIFG